MVPVHVRVPGKLLAYIFVKSRSGRFYGIYRIPVRCGQNIGHTPYTGRFCSKMQLVKWNAFEMSDEMVSAPVTGVVAVGECNGRRQEL